MRRNWDAILVRAAEIVASYDTFVTLRQLFYRLVSELLIHNTRSDYNQLSSRTAEARRAGWFPGLVDRTRSIQRYRTFAGPTEASHWLASIYRRDRTEGQEFSVYVGVEKHGIVNQLQAWFGDFGVPIIALGGYSSQAYADEIAEDVEGQDPPPVLVYAGDFDPSGMDILRDFVERTACFEKVVRVALNAEQVVEFDLPPQMGKSTDTRAASFIARYGHLVQVELDALRPPDVLRRLYEEAITEFFDLSIYEEVMAREAEERAALQ